MKAKYVFLLPLMSMVALCYSCTATGKWTLQTTDPSAVRADFCPHTLTLQEDGTFYADTNKQLRTGVWSWNGSMADGLLVLDERGGGSDSFKASIPNNQTLVLQTDLEGRAVTGTYDRKQ